MRSKPDIKRISPVLCLSLVCMICRPFGMVNLSPGTWVQGTWNSGFMYDSLHVRCFSHIHAWQMAGIPVMPTGGPFRGHLGMEANKSGFPFDRESVTPGSPSTWTPIIIPENHL